MANMQMDDFEPEGVSEVMPLEFRSMEMSGAAREVSRERDEYASFIEQYDAFPPVDLEAVAQEAREQARTETAQRLEAQLREQLERERLMVTRSLQQFESEKKRYFAEVEAEVVRLSLAIAERVLHREVQMDPLLLAGAARVALEQVAEGDEAVLKVAAEQVQSWSEALSDAAELVSIRPDPAVEPGEAILQTRSGTVHLGIRAQLQEIERGFFALLGCRSDMAN